MLNDLRQILEEDNRIESDLEIMMEAATDSDMMDAFIDEDGEAEIPESELTKILSKIPEYNRDEELNKKLKRLTESVIPDYEILEEKSTLKDKMIRFRDDVRDDNPMVYDAVIGAYLLGIPGLVIGLVGSDFIRDKVSDRLQAKTAVYTKGEPLRKEKITELLNACKTKKDIKKFEKWLKKVYRNLKVVTQDDPEIQTNMDEFRDWIRDEILQKQLKVRKAEIKKGIVESFDDFDDEYDFMTDEEFCEAMDVECEEYLKTLEEQNEYDDEDYDVNNSSLNESMTLLEQASLIVDDILEENKLVNAVNNFNAKHNKGKYGKIRERVTKKISKCKSEDKLTALEKDLQMGIAQLNEMISKVEKPEEKKEIKDHIKWCKGEAKRLIKSRRKEIRNK